MLQIELKLAAVLFEPHLKSHISCDCNMLQAELELTFLAYAPSFIWPFSPSSFFHISILF